MNRRVRDWMPEPLLRRWRRLDNNLADRRALAAWSPPLLPAAQRWVFLCQGNICRSPFAEAYIAARTGEVTAYSAGVIAHADGRSPLLAVEAAAAFDVDLTAHRPRSIDQIVDDRLTLYFVMEPWHGRDRRLKKARRERRVLLLGNWADPAVGAVRDPYGGELAVFQACFEQMAVAMNRLMAASAAGGRR